MQSVFFLITTRNHGDDTRREEKHHTDDNEDGYHAPKILEGLFGISMEKETHVRDC